MIKIILPYSGDYDTNANAYCFSLMEQFGLTVNFTGEIN